jgi:hypothetical protein
MVVFHDNQLKVLSGLLFVFDRITIPQLQKKGYPVKAAMVN